MHSCRFINDAANLELHCAPATSGQSLVANITSVQVVLIGDAANLGRRGGDFASDNSGAFLGILHSNNERLFLRRQHTINTHLLPTNFNIGHGGIADMCGDNSGGFLVVYVDNNQNFWGVHIAQNGTIRRTQFFDSSIESVAVCLDRVERVYKIAFVKEGSIYWRSLSLNLNSTTQAMPLDEQNVQAVDFVKNTLQPQLLITRANRIFLRRSRVQDALKQAQHTLNLTARVNVVVGLLTLDDILGGVALGDMTPAQIKMVADLGLAQNFFNIGDAVTIPLSAFTHPVTGAAIPAQNATFEIWGFNHDDKADGSGRAPITFGMRHLLGQGVRLNPTNNNAGGWNATETRTAFMGAVMGAMPQEWRDIISPVTKLTANNGSQNGNGTANIIPSTDSVFLFSQNEISTNTASVIAGEGLLYEFWTNRQANVDRIKLMSNGFGAASFWWLRSPDATSATFFRDVVPAGDLSVGSASSARGLCFGFCV